MRMIIPAVMLVILAVVVIRSLMGVVAHEDVAAPISLAAEPPTPTGVWGDDVRSFLLPAAEGHIDLAQNTDVDHDADANAS
jgi:hypothetical protein